MGFKTDYKEITLKDFCNLNCISRNMDVTLYDYNSPIMNPVSLTDDFITVDEIPEEFADWYVESIYVRLYKDASGFTNYHYLIDIREP